MAGLALLALQVSLLGFYLGSYAAVLLFKLVGAAYRGWRAGWRGERRR